MPSSQSQVETTLADLAINLVFERTPGLADHYLGFEIIPGSQNDEKTRAAGLLGFRVGNEELYIPILFLNGKVKGAEVIYLSDADVFTSNSKQWIDYLTTRDTGVMGGGATSKTPLQQPSPQGLAVFSRNPGSIGKVGSLFDGAAGDFWSKIASAEEGWTDINVGGKFSLKNVLTSLGEKAYTKFANFLDENPAMLAKVAQHFDINTEVLLTWPEQKTAAYSEISDEDVDSFFKSASAIADEYKLFVITPDEIEAFSKRASDYSSQTTFTPDQAARLMQNGPDYIDAATNNPINLSAVDVARNMTGWDTTKALFGQNKDEIAHRVFPVLGGRLAGLGGSPLAGAALGALIGNYSTDDEDKKNRRRLMGTLIGGGAGLLAAPAMSNMLGAYAAKQAAILSLSPEQKEQCFTDGYIVLDKRAADEKPLVVNEDYCQRFSAPVESGFYEILTSSGELEKVFVAHQPFTVEYPEKRMHGAFVIDPESGVYVLPAVGEQLFIRSKFTTDEAVWKEKAGKMPAVSSMEVGKSYMLISSTMDTSAPFRVKGKTKKGSELSFSCETPWDVRYRCMPLIPSYGYVCSSPGGDDSISVLRVIDREDESKVAKVGSITYVPSSWKVIEVYEESSNLKWDRGSYPADGAEEKKARAEREEKSKVYYRIFPGDSKTLSSVLANKNIHELTVHKSASDYTVRIDKEIVSQGSKIAALQALVSELGLGLDDASSIVDNSLTQNGTKQWVMVKSAEEAPPGLHIPAGVLVGAGIGGGVGAAAGVALPAAIGSLLGKAIGNNLSAKNDKERARKGHLGAVIGGIGGGLLSIPTGALGMGTMMGTIEGGALGAVGGPGITVNGAKLNDALAQAARIKGAFAESADEAFERILFGKSAAGPPLNGDGLIYGGMPFPEDTSEIGTTEQGFKQTGPQFQSQQVPLNSMADPSQDWRNMDEANWDKIQKHDMDFLMRAADSGSKPVFESSIINLLLKTNRTSNQVDEWLPDLVNSLDSKCRLLLLFYWHNSDFSESYGKDEMAEFEDVLLNSIKIDGQLVLFLKQKAGESSSSKIDAFAG